MRGGLGRMRALRAAVAAVVAAGTVGITGAASGGAAGHDIVYLATLQHQPATSGYTAFEIGSTSSIVVNIRREQHGIRQATVDYTTIATGSASPGTDYTTTSGTMTLDGGTSEDGFEIPILADGSEEGPETFDIELSNPRSQPGDQMILSFPRRATVTIVDDDGPSRISFAAGNYEQFENRGSIALVVIRQGDASAGASAQLDTSDGTATAPGDYTAQSAPVSFTAGEAGLRVKRISVPVINDSAGEDPETFTAALSNETGAALVSPSTVTIELLDDDSQSSDRTAPVSTFHLPRDGKTYRPNSTPAKEVHISPSDEGSGVADIFLALRKKLRNGKCQWWRGNRFRQSSCSRKKWLDLPYKRTCFDKDNPFCIYQFGRRLQPTTRKTGIRNYTAWARAEDRAGNIEDIFRAGRNQSTYRIKP